MSLKEHEELKRRILELFEMGYVRESMTHVPCQPY